MTAGALTALSMISSVYGSTIFQVDDNFVIWQAGMAAKLDNGAWVGSSFETWPGVNPPWNPVTSTRAGVDVCADVRTGVRVWIDVRAGQRTGTWVHLRPRLRLPAAITAAAGGAAPLHHRRPVGGV